MTRIGWEIRANDFRKELTRIRERAGIGSGKFQDLQKQAESCKVQFLSYQLEGKRKVLARDRGLASVTKNEKGSLVVRGLAAAATILIGKMSKDGLIAVNAGLSGLNEALRGLGETDWAVCPGRQLVITSCDNVTPENGWITWDSFKTALSELEERAKKGAQLGNRDAIISELRRSKKLVHIFIIPVAGTGEP